MIKLDEYTATSANILTCRIGTNCPQGGDSGHGGITILEFEDKSSTDMNAELSNLKSINLMGDKIRLVFGGDCECETLIECLEFAAKTLRSQLTINETLNQ